MRCFAYRVGSRLLSLPSLREMHRRVECLRRALVFETRGTYKRRRRKRPTMIPQQSSETQPSMYVPWALAGSFGILCLLLLVLGGSLRDRNARLAEKLSEAERLTANLREERAEAQARARQTQTNQA